MFLRTLAFFSAEKTMQRYNKFLRNANDLLFFCIIHTIFFMLCTKNAFVTRYYVAKIQQKNRKRKSLHPCAPISPKKSISDWPDNPSLFCPIACSHVHR